MRECILPQETTDFKQLVDWMEQNIGPCVWQQKTSTFQPYAEGKNWFVIGRINPDDVYKVIITDYTAKVDQYYTELKLKWG